MITTFLTTKRSYLGLIFADYCYLLLLFIIIIIIIIVIIGSYGWITNIIRLDWLLSIWGQLIY